jgi:hypothetical protein
MTLSNSTLETRPFTFLESILFFIVKTVIDWLHFAREEHEKTKSRRQRNDLKNKRSEV